jgi:HD-GYP domain-containing protein (c-di-GMP phosphodiesterase class II)
VIGVLEVFSRTQFEPDKEWLDFLGNLAGQAALTVEDLRLLESLHHSNAELTLAYDETIEGWSRAMELRDRETEGHTRRVTELTVELAQRMGLPDEMIVHIRRGVMLHDVGKIGVPDNILHKPGPLTEPEMEIMRRHSRLAYELIAPIAYLQPALDIPYCHHEKWDGTGYPRGLKGDQIPQTARLFAVVDVYDALTSDRPYRRHWTEQKAVHYILAQSGKHFDPAVVELFLKMIEKS